MSNNNEFFSKEDIYLFNEGRHYRIYEKLGAQASHENGEDGYRFSVWAPNANNVSLIGDFNYWAPYEHYLSPVGNSGIWSIFLPWAKKGMVYKYHICSNNNVYEVQKADPVGFYHEVPPRTASVVWNYEYKWKDSKWMAKRKDVQSRSRAMSTYELHVGSWAQKIEDNNRPLTYLELAEKLPKYIKENGFTHVELMPLMEHPFGGSWGYQVTGYFAPTSRFGTPEDLMFLIDKLHEQDIGVIMDWVPSHFPSDQHGLGYFDGTHLYEHSDWRQGFHPDWNSLIFNYGRNEVRSFLYSSALFWLDKFHIDGLRVDGVASMLYLDYSRKEGEWIPNVFGSRENLEAISFLKQFNEIIYLNYPDVHTIAEESTDWAMVSRPTSMGGLGFGMKWDMGWMHDTLKYFQKDPIHRSYHQNDLTFHMLYVFNENFILSISHDEVVHGKGSMIGKMPGDEWQKFANLRLLYSYMYSQPGKKLIFMGSEFAQWSEWNHESSLDWHLLEFERHREIQKTVRDLNFIYSREKALHEIDFEYNGFEWIDGSDSANCVISYLRKGRQEKDTILAIFNFTPVPRHNYRVGVNFAGTWREIFNSDSTIYGGSGQGNLGGVETVPVKSHGRLHSLNLTLPPLSAVFLKWEGIKDNNA